MERQTSVPAGRLLLAIAALALACQTQPTSGTTHEFAIRLDAAGCPVALDVPERSACKEHRGACAKKEDKLSWVAERPFAIHFDPLHGPSTQSPRDCTGACKTKPLRIHPKAPPFEKDTEVKYKYTIVVPGCPTPLDPPIFIQK